MDQQLNWRQKINSSNGSLIIASAQSTLDEANYECALVEHTTHHQQQQDGEESSSSSTLRELKWHRFELRLIVAPKLAPFEFAANAQVGMKVVLTCSALEGQQPMSFVWLKDNQLIDSGASVGVQAQQQSLGANSLSQVHQQQLADKFALSSSGNNAGGAIVSLHQHQQQSNNEYSLVSQQQQADFESTLDTPQLLPLLSDSNIRIRQADDYSILSIDKLELKHSGRYTCSVQNEAARTSHSSQLTINGKYHRGEISVDFRVKNPNRLKFRVF